MTEPRLDHSIFGGHDEHHEHPDVHHGDAPVRTRSERHQRPRRRRRRRGRRFGILVVALAIVAAAALAAYTVLRPVVDGFLESNDYPGPGTGQVQVTIKDGDLPPAMGRALVAAGVVKSTKAFADAAAANPRITGVQPGTYTFRKQMRAVDALAILIDPSKRGAVPRVTIREGLWKNEVFAALSKASGIPVAQYQAAAKDPAALDAERSSGRPPGELVRTGGRKPRTKDRHR